MRRRKGILSMVLMVLAFVAVQSAVAQFHFEMGFNAPVGFGVINDKGTYGQFTNVLKEIGFLPIPFASAYVGKFEQGGGVGIGIKAHSAIIATIAYPSVMGQIIFSRFSIDASVGGLYVLHYLIGENFGVSAIPALIPELSLWYSLDRKSIFRVGGGILAILPSDFSFSEVSYVGWVGLKAVL